MFILPFPDENPCEDCNGLRKIFNFGEKKFIPCYTCGGDGYISLTIGEWIDKQKQHRLQQEIRLLLEKIKDNKPKTNGTYKTF